MKAQRSAAVSVNRVAPGAGLRPVIVAALIGTTLADGAAFAQAPTAAQDAPPASTGVDDGAADQAESQRFDINEFVVRGNSVLPLRDVEKAVYPHMGPQRTLADARAARDALTRLYQERGFQSVVVELPPQRVVGGSIRLQVNEAKIGRVRVVGAEHYSPLAVRDAVPSLAEGKVPNFAGAQRELTDLNRDPKRQVVPLLRPGVLPGTLDLDLKVDDRSPWRGSVGVNNDYSADTEELRAVASVGHDNLWQRGHSASITFFTAPEDTGQVKVWSGSYLAPLPRSDWSLQLAGYTSDSNVATVGSTTVLGKGETVGLSAIYRFPSAGSWAHSLSFGLDYKDIDQTLQFGEDVSEAPIRYWPVSVAWNGYRAGERSSDVFGLTLTGTFGGLGSDDLAFDNQRFKANPGFAVLRGNWERTQTVGSDWQLGARVNAQLATGPLISSEQLAIGGAYSVRGYLSAESTGDYGYAVSLEWRTPSFANAVGSWVDEWRLYAFVDGGMLWLHDPLPDQDEDFALASVGIGTSWQLVRFLSGSLEWAFPLREGPNTDNGSSRVLFNVRAGF